MSLLLPLGLLLCCSACGTRQVQTWYVAAPVVAVNVEGEGVPVDVRLYALRQPQAFLASDFDLLWEQPEQVLQADLLAPPHDLTVRGDQTTPPTAQRLQFPRWPSSAEFIGLQLLTPHAPAIGSRRIVVPVVAAEQRLLRFAHGAVSLEVAPTHVYGRALHLSGEAP